MDLPTLDFSNFSSNDASERKDLAGRMMESFRIHGAVRLINHGIPVEAISSVFQWLSLDARSRIPNIRDDTLQRGWSFQRSESNSKLNMTDENGSVPTNLFDKKEHFDWVIDDDEEFPNKWPAEEEIPNFRAAMTEFVQLCHNTGLRVLQAMDIWLELPSGTLAKRCESPVTEARTNVQRAWPHTDFGLITLLFQDAVGGLEIEDRENPRKFIPIIQENPTEVAVYISDTMESLANVASFVKASRNTSAGPLPHFVNRENPEQYEGMTAFELHRKRVGQLFVD
ncbi:oxidoreductase [Dactylonectria macrodidyma]|uniref:Oxidoreductase n=1 Tax=Dactylonectria macrodidyma TaxID=307937 RepID=A0A9P9JJI5_9HYPO|nr:oxidoreductase [Dactylonectria macrodidyma]